MSSDDAARQCRHCLSHEVAPARYHGLEFLAAIFLLRPFRCRRCLRRFLAFALPTQW